MNATRQRAIRVTLTDSEYLDLQRYKRIHAVNTDARALREAGFRAIRHDFELLGFDPRLLDRINFTDSSPSKGGI